MCNEADKKVDFRTSISQLVRLTDTEEVWFESPQMYLRIKMAIANFYFENKQFDSLQKKYMKKYGNLTFDTEELKKQELKLCITMLNNYPFKKIMKSRLKNSRERN